MLDKNIKIDLHIHSKISEYKEDDKIVSQSTFENIDLLLNKLDSPDHAINMFSFTDHNRFDANLYIKTREKIESSTFSHLKTLLAGVEFDVLLDVGMKPCHVITIFNAKNNDELMHIESTINDHLLTNKEDYYEKSDFEDLLRKINLETILIVAQRKNFKNHDGKHRSLSDSTKEPFKYLKYGYFDALEYQKPNVDGILLNQLDEINLDFSLVLGSDCHEWEFYPKHDESSEDKLFIPTSIRALPTFKGLLLALTSPNTRLNRTKKANKILTSLEANENIYNLSSGINAIIGENGSGKSLLINAISNKFKSYYKDLIKNNKIKFNGDMSPDKTLNILQGEITNNQYNNGSIFGKNISYFKDVDNYIYINSLNLYSKNLFEVIDFNIELEDLKKNLSKVSFEYNDEIESRELFYIDITVNTDFNNSTNIHNERKEKLESIINLIKNEIDSEYYDTKENEVFKNAIKDFTEILEEIISKHNKRNTEISIKNMIVNKINTYTNNISRLKGVLEQELTDYNQEKQTFKDSIINYVRKQINPPNIDSLKFPYDVKGRFDNPVKGFVFSKITNYDNENLIEDYYKLMFVSNYNTLDKVLLIKSKSELSDAIRNSSTIEDIETNRKKNLEKFTTSALETKEIILELSKGVEIGNTLGEMSLVYYKFQLHNHESWDLILIDQPEDNISSLKIKNELINIFDSLRDIKQVIFVTHNPMLVINLDVDNVIYVEKESDNISVISGPLEDENNKILEIVAKNMDGGKDTIEKRLKYYGKNN